MATAKVDIKATLKSGYRKMVEDVEGMEEDWALMVGGNKAAGKRNRKVLMDIKKACGELRKASIELKNS